VPNQPEPAVRATRKQVEDSTNLADKAGEAAEQAKQAAIERVESLREQAVSGIEQGRSQVAERIRHVGSALRSAGDDLRDQDEVIATYLDRASAGVERVASYVTSANPQSLARDAQDFARQRPAWFFGAAFLLGLAGGRFLKASAARGAEPLELDDSELEDLPRARRQPPRKPAQGQRSASAYGDEPIMPSATIPVTQGQRPTAQGQRAEYERPPVSGPGNGSNRS